MMKQLDGPQAVAGLQSIGRNMFLNPAFASPWASEMNTAIVPQGDTRFDPFMGTGWDRWLDMAGAKQPGGIRMGGQLGNAAIGGLQRAFRLPKPASKPQEADAYYEQKYPGVR